MATRNKVPKRLAAPVPPVHRIPPRLLAGPVRIAVIGCGGNGSEIAAGLPYLHQALLAFGHPAGIEVLLVDGDLVSETNTVRQAFSRADVGQPKATMLIHRINNFYGLRWRAIARNLEPKMGGGFGADIVIGCVDSRRARKTIWDFARNDNRVAYWLDLGNEASDGQFVLGVPPRDQLNAGKFIAGVKPPTDPSAPSVQRLPTVAELFPESIAVAADKTDTMPSCSAQEALQRQEPFVNRVLAAQALGMLTRLFRYGELGHHGAFVNLATGKSQPIPVSPEQWARMMAQAPAKRGRIRPGKAA